MRQNWNELQQKDRCKIFVVAVAFSPTAWVCLRLLFLQPSSRKRSEISDATDTENFSCPCWSSFQFCLIYVMAPHATRAYNLPVIQLFVARADLRCKTLNVVETFLSGSRISDWDKCSARAHIAWETMILHRPKRSVECSDSEKNMSAFADQNHAPSLTCVRLESKNWDEIWFPGKFDFKN